MENQYRRWVPPALLERLRPMLRHGIYFSGNYADWSSASKEAGGYDAKIILEKVKQATLLVVSGKAAFERDSVVFDTIQHPFPLISGLLRAAIEDKGRLSVLDFGGSLGSSFFQCRKFLSVVEGLQWSVVEQPHFVRCGRECIKTDQLNFYFDIEEATQSTTPNVGLLASVLQYVPEPYAVLDRLAQAEIRYLIIDRTPFSGLMCDEITVQHVPPEIYPASYPCWIFSKQAMVERLSKRFELLADFQNSDGGAIAGGVQFAFGGMILRKK